MSKNYKNIVLHDHVSLGEERRKALAKEAFRDDTPFPKTVTYEDIDREFRRWVEEDLDITFEGTRLPTMVLYSNQRFSEYMQSWQNVDDKRNLLLNFKAISRETNPQAGTSQGNYKNIPGERDYIVDRVLTQDDAGRNYYLVYKMKQPFCTDLKYKISIVTNKIELLNQFNMMVNDKFKAIDAYIRPNGHFMSMKIDNISDDSEFSIDDRQFFSQTYNILLRAYIIREEDYSVEEAPVLRFLGVDFDIKTIGNCDVEAEDDGDNEIITCTFKEGGVDKRKFTLDCGMLLNSIDAKNINSFTLYFNDEPVDFTIIDSKCYTTVEYNSVGLVSKKIFDEHTLVNGSEIKITNVILGKESAQGKIIFTGKQIFE